MPASPSCEVCGALGVHELTGKDRRLDWLKASFPKVSEERKAALAERIMDLVDTDVRWRCEDCSLCGCCSLTAAGLADCAICGAPACSDCSLPALQVDADGRIIDGSDEGKVLCARCNPPSGGHNARLDLPAPVRPLALV